MQNKFLIQLFLAITVFFGSWFLLSNIDYMAILKLSDKVDSLEKKLGETYYKLLIEGKKMVNDSTMNHIDKIKNKICEANDIDPQKIKVHVLSDPTVNAFALPDNNLVLLTGLIEDTQTPEELAGVMAHEIAHMEKKHVMKKLQKEIGLTVLYSMAGGRGGAEGLRVLTSSAYDRTLENEADMIATDYLAKAKINPEGLANFLYRLSLQDEKINKNLVWISTHPDSENRSESIIKSKSAMTIEFNELMSSADWADFKKRVKKN